MLLLLLAINLYVGRFDFSEFQKRDLKARLTNESMVRLHYECIEWLDASTSGNPLGIRSGSRPEGDPAA
jgi:hypothetical protein